MNNSNSQSSRDLFPTGDNPYQAPQSAMEPPAVPAGEKRTRWFRAAATLQAITIVVGTAAAFWEIESIIASGATVFFLGLLTAILALRCRHDDGFAFGLAFGLSGPAIAISCFLLIFLMDWGPSNAQDPVSKIILTYSLISLPFGVTAISRRSRAAPEKDQPASASHTASPPSSDMDIWQ